MGERSIPGYSGLEGVRAAVRAYVDKARGVVGTHLFRNSFFLLVRSALSYGLGFLFWLAVARAYDPAALGLASVILNMVLLLARGTALGLPTGVLRFLPAEKDKGELLNSAFTIAALSSVVLGIVFVVGVDLWVPSLSFVRTDPALAVAFVLSLIFFSLDGIVDNAFVAARRADYGMVRTTLFHALRLPLVFVFAFLGVMGIVSAWTLSLVVSVLGMGFFLRRFYENYRYRPTIKSIRGTGILGFSLWSYVTGIVDGASIFLLPVVILSVLPGLVGATAAGYYAAAYTIATLLYVVPTSFATALLVEGSHPGTRYATDLRNTVKYSVPLLAIGIAGCIFLGRPILNLFGSGYSREGYETLVLLALASPLILATQIYTTELRIYKRVIPIFWVTAVTSVVTVVVAVLLLPTMGIQGAAIGTIVGQAADLAGYILIKRFVIGKGGAVATG